MNERPFRVGASRVLSGALVVLAVAVAVQVGLAGASTFGASAWNMHMMLGGLIVVLAIVTLVAALVARPGREMLAASAVILVLTGLQPILARLAEGSDPWFGLLHAVVALPLFTLPVWAVWAVWVSLTRRRSVEHTTPHAS